jgi:hypothetical protein
MTERKGGRNNINRDEFIKFEDENIEEWIKKYV